MAAVQRFDAAFGIFLRRWMRDNMHTSLRGKVVGVDYSGPTVDVQPMAKTVLSDGTEDGYPTIFNVPVQLPSANGGKARLTMPIKVGDMVGINFSERNEDNSSDQSTHGLFAGFAVTEIYTPENAKPIDPDKVVLENDKVKISLSPEGSIIIETPKSSFQMLEDGSSTMKNGGGTFKMETSGLVDANGAKITPDGRIITKKGVDLDSFFETYLLHTHGGVESGGSNTNKPN
ncbi:Gp138 family membrane-puncturing spike protein [Burkholderia pseudomallei]|jgi:hypothetical protein|uniref:Gp138 family membrane-puncturing spike protein n=1 Tax=Burkholderia pseudomallei TaxID=28450 RepID=UPI0024E02899|nr:Gp138 family membrane-puncturing spike protein [Burkholderia pseudomallei]